MISVCERHRIMTGSGNQVFRTLVEGIIEPLVEKLLEEIQSLEPLVLEEKIEEIPEEVITRSCRTRDNRTTNTRYS